jgi:hypothetical protein
MIHPGLGLVGIGVAIAALGIVGGEIELREERRKPSPERSEG